tara:strand:- start:354 stop:947 length:594 start_codon:yes stop_codon:yes gene_type:complete
MAEDNNKLVLYFALLILILLLVLLFQAYNSKCKVFNYESFNNQSKSNADIYNEQNVINGNGMSNDIKYSPSDPEQPAYTELVSNNQNQVNTNPETSCFPRSSLTAKDLLPADLDATTSKWSELNPTTGGAIDDQNLLTAGWTVGVNTVQNSLRNPNLQIRSEPPNPVKPVSPWMISTIGPDTNRRDMEIGSQPYWEN